MKKWYMGFSDRQRVELVAVFGVMAIIIGVGVVANLGADTNEANVEYTVDMSISEIAPGIGVTGKSLARELELDLDAPKKKPLKTLGVSQDQLDHSVEHILSHDSTSMKYYVYFALVFFGFMYLTRFGRPDGLAVAERKDWYARGPYIVCLVAAVVVCGFLLGKSPNPMEGVVKVFKSMVGLYPSVTDKILGFAFFVVLAVVGNKLICGWACPFGALQELIYSIPILGKIKKMKVPFLLSNGIRGGLFVVALLVLFGIIGGKEGFVIYHYLNPFNLFDLKFENVFILISVIVFLIAAFFVYRPFCLFICPFGFVSWVAERFSLYRVVIDKDKCTNCGACVKACPLEAAKGRVEGKLFPADCFSCARCLNTCPFDAISYKPIWTKVKSGDGVVAEANQKTDPEAN